MVETPRKSRPTTHLEVLDKEWVSPHLVRLVIGGPNFTEFQNNPHTDAYVKILFGADGSALTAPVQMSELRETLPAAELPITRTYTVRWVDTEKQCLAIDFVIHGDTGVAGAWAAQAKPGELIQFMGPGGRFSPDPDLFWIFLGDSSASPAIARSIETLPESATGQAFISRAHEDEDFPISAPPSVSITWFDDTAEAALANQLRTLLSNLPAGIKLEQVGVFAHGEREAMKQVRKVVKEFDIAKDQLSLSGYWARGRVEQQFQAEKRLPIGEV